VDYTVLETGTIQCNQNHSHTYTLSYASNIKIDIDDGKHVIEADGPGTLYQQIRKHGFPQPPSILNDFCNQGLKALWAITEHEPKKLSEFSDDEIQKSITENVSEHLVDAVTKLFMEMKSKGQQHER